MSARVIKVIETDLDLRGRGVEGDPIRRIRQYWSLNGQLLAEVDPYLESMKEQNRHQPKLSAEQLKSLFGREEG